MLRHLLGLTAALFPLAIVACGGSGTTAATGTGTGGHAATTGSHTTGSGGAATSSSHATGTGGSTTASTGTMTASASSGGTGGMAAGACKNAMDGAILASEDIKSIVSTCAKNNAGQEPATKDCIKDGNNPDAGVSKLLSDGCTKCFDDEVQCIFAHCLGMCLADPMGAACNDCRKTNCDPAFAACSGLPTG